MKSRESASPGTTSLQITHGNGSPSVLQNSGSVVINVGASHAE
jgi:hypothetical protein